MLRALGVRLLAFRAEMSAEEPNEWGKPEDDRDDAEDGTDGATKKDG